MDYIISILPQMWLGTIETLKLFFITIVLSIPLGILLALARVSSLGSQSRPFRCTGIYESDRTRASYHAFGNSHRKRANAIGTNTRSLSYGSLPCRNSLGRFELFVRSKRNETLSTSVGIALPLLHQCLPQCRTAQSVGRI